MNATGVRILDYANGAGGRILDYMPEFELRTDKPEGVPYRVGDPTVLHRYYTPRVSLAECVKRALG